MTDHFGPFRIEEGGDEGDLENPIPPPARNHDCPHYSECLNIVAALNWDSFTCTGCAGSPSDTLLWQAHQATRRDAIAGQVCKLTPLDAVALPKKRGRRRKDQLPS